MFPPISQPGNEPETWDGTSDISWYSESRNTFALDTAEELAGLSELVNSGNPFEGKTIRLRSSIDLNGFEFTPIGSNNIPFKGIFDGGNNTIYGFDNDSTGICDDDGNRYFTAFFTSVDGGTIKNISFEDFNVEMNENVPTDRVNQRMVSVAVGNLMNGGTVENVTVGEGVVVSPVRAAGVVARASNGSEENPNRIINCTNYADVFTETIGEDHVAELTYGTAGGILSTTAGGLVVIEKSENHGTVEGMVSGGILGDAQSTVEISGCNNNGNIRGAFFVGGIIGDFWHNGGNGTISDCHNLKGAVVESHESFQTADGKPNDGTFGDVNIGGIAGAAGVDGNVTIEDSSNEGTLINHTEQILASVGGIIGTGISSSTTRIEIIDTTSTGIIQNAAKESPDDRGIYFQNRNKWTTGGVIGYARGMNYLFKNSYGYYPDFSDDYYEFGDIAGSLNAGDQEGTVTVEFSEPFESEQLFGIVRNFSASNSEISFENVHAIEQNFALCKDEMNLTLDSGSHIETAIQLYIGDDGDSSYGMASISGNIDNLVIYPEANGTGDSYGRGYPNWGEWTNSVNVENDPDGFSWKCPAVEYVVDSVSILINSNKILDVSRSVQ